MSINGQTLTRIKDEVGQFRTDWKTWQARYDVWMRWLHTSRSEKSSTTNIGTMLNAGDTRQVQQRRSKYFSEWAISRRNALHWRMLGAKTTVLPTVYGEDETERRAGEQLTQLALGIFALLDSQKVRGGGMYSWDADFKQRIADYGKVAFMPEVYDMGKGLAGVRARFLDVYNLYHDMDSEPGDLMRYAYEFNIKWREVPAYVRSIDGEFAPQRPQDKDENDDAVVVTYWKEEHLGEGKVMRAILIDGRPIREDVEWLAEGFGSIPIVMERNQGASHSQQQIRSGNSLFSNAKNYYHAEPFYARAISQLEFLEGLESLRADAAALSSLPMFLWRRGKAGDSNAGNMEKYPLATIPLAEDEQLAVLDGISRGALSVDIAIDGVKRSLNDIFPDFLVSPFPLNVSGFSANSQIEQSEIYMTPWTRMSEGGKKGLIEQVIEQHVLTPHLNFALRGVLPEGGRFATTFTVKDYPKGHFDIDFEEPAEIPGQALQAMNLATQGISNGTTSIWTANVTYLKRNDPMAEEDRKIDEQIRLDQESVNRRKLIQRREEVAALFAKAERLEKPENKAAAFLEATVARIEFDRLAQQLLGAPNTGFQQKPQRGTPPEVNPPENTTQNPDQLALGEGRQSSSTQGRPRPEGAR